MGAPESKVKAGAAVVAALAVGASVWFVSRTTPESRTPAAEAGPEMIEPARLVPPPVVESQPPGQVVVPAAVAPAAPRVAPVVAPLFDSPECPDLVFVESHSAESTTVATLRHGAASPEQVTVGSLLESGEVIFIGSHPQTSAPTVLLKADDGRQCRVSAPAPVAARPSFEQTRIDQMRAHPSQPRVFANNVGAPTVRSLKARIPDEAWAKIRK